MCRKFNKGDIVEYYGDRFEVFESYKGSKLVVLKSLGTRKNILYVWASKCRKVG